MAGKKVKSGEERETVVFWKEEVRNIEESYRQYVKNIAFAVQKDAIQNAWDARVDKKHAKDWEVEFRLIEGKNNFLVITDKETSGLTGRVLEGSEYQASLPEEERWARFESLAFKKVSRGALGSRGRGKFIFVVASKKVRLLYDTLRADGVYRLGLRKVLETRSPVQYWEDEEAEKILKKETGGAISPLSECGTRIIIPDPTPEVVSSIIEGDFMKAIEETWWQLFEECDADISVVVGNKKKNAEHPRYFELPEEDSKNTKTLQISNDNFNFAGRKYKVKKLHIVATNIVPPPQIQGIAIQRSGMKIFSLAPRGLPAEITERIYGYIVLDEDGDFALRQIENPEHYGINLHAGFAIALRKYIEEQIFKFAYEKLGLRSKRDAIQKQHHRNAERKAIEAVNRTAAKYGFTGGKFKRKGKQRETEERKYKKIRVSPEDYLFPREDDIRVNYGEEINNITATALNKTHKKIRLKARIYIEHGGEEFKLLVERDMDVQAEDETPFIKNALSLKISNEHFPKSDRYNLVAELIALDNFKAGDVKIEKAKIVDRRKQSMYVEMDPPGGGIFESCQGVEYGDFHMMGQAIRGEKNGYIFEYNLEHPAYKQVEVDENELAYYLYSLMISELCIIDSGSPEPHIFKKEDIETPEGVLREYRKVIGKALSEYITGE